MNTVGKHIKAIRLERSLTQDELADRLHVVRQTVSSWETGKTEPDIDTLIAIAEVLSVGVAELIYGRKPPDDFAAGKPARIRHAKRAVFLFAIVLMLTLLWKPLLLLLGIENDINQSYDLFSRGHVLHMTGLYTLPALTFCLSSIALVASVSVWWDFRFKKNALRKTLLIVTTVLQAVFLLSMQLWLWIPACNALLAPLAPLFAYSIWRPPLFFIPGLLIGLWLNK